ncbi:hypothetical protein M885DRAFT_525467 [Pelagophyceae sp. CCMP2097]|nr:hypothetical protein M885DRAFT_525467 [Pelagophyceae sp. CCMP2097]
MQRFRARPGGMQRFRPAGSSSQRRPRRGARHGGLQCLRPAGGQPGGLHRHHPAVTSSPSRPGASATPVASCGGLASSARAVSPPLE